MPSNLMQRGAAWLGRQLQANAGRTVTIVQGTTTLAGIVGTVGQHEYEVDDAEGFLTKIVAFDWVFVAADLGGLKLRDGAEIRETLGGVESRYEVLPMGKRPCFEDADSSGVLKLVHTKKVS